MRRFLALALMSACGGPQLVEHHTDLTKLLPATLEAVHGKEGDPRTVHVRIWADVGVRALPHWKEDITDQLDYASQLLTPLLGIKLAVDAVKDWDRTDAGGVHDALRVLSQADAGDNVTWVIGYITQGDVASKAMGELGDAMPLGHQIIVRGWAEKPETAKMAGLLPDLKDAERTEVIGAHRRHKQTVVLLHMLAASLGAIAEADPTWIQHVSYAPKQATFSERNRELMNLAIDDRLAGGTDLTTAKKLLEAIEKSDWGGWIPTDHDAVVLALRNVVDQGKAGKTAADVPAAAYEQYSRIVELRKTDPKSALVELDNLLAAYPGNATIHLLQCEILLGGPYPDRPAPAGLPEGAPRKPGPPRPAPAPQKPAVLEPKTRAICAHVSELAPGDPTPHLAVAEALARAGDDASARAELVQAEPKIANLPKGANEAWRRVVALYMGMGALTWTEEALDKGTLGSDPAATSIKQIRARYGVQRGGKYIKPEDEAALVGAVKSSLDLVYASKFAEAGKAIAAAEKRWPGAPGLAASRCDLALRQDQVEAARAACARAIAVDPEESWALYLSGVIDFRDASATKAGIAKLRKAIAVDPDLGQAWRTLGKALDREHDKAGLAELAQAYQAKFGSPLPP
jgi:tetratricopeptide (TPR) repeat protein